MLIEPLKKQCQVIEFEALGMQHKSYCEIGVHEEVVSWSIKLITSTAHITCIYTDLVELDLFDEKNLDKLIEYHNTCQSYENGSELNQSK